VLVFGAVPFTALATNNVTIVDESGNQTLEEGYGVITGVRIWDMYTGANATAPLYIINGKDSDKVFFIRVEEPNDIEVGYAPLSEECYSWITIGDNMVPAIAGETVRVPITITIPDDIVYENRHDAVAFFVKDITQTGFQQIAYQSTWYITTDHVSENIPAIISGGINVAWIVAIIGIVIMVCLIYLRRRSHAKE